MLKIKYFLSYTLLFSAIANINSKQESACGKILFDQSHKSGQGPEWSYHNKNWANENETYKECAQQSPIDINEQAKNLAVSVHKDGEIQFFYGPDQAQKYIIKNGKRYNLLQFHFHAPSEHKIKGIGSVGELHFVHQSAGQDGEYAVVGILLHQSESSSSILSKFIDDLVNNKINPKNNLDFDLNLLMPQNRSFYHYTGSLTTPPFTKGINWNVLKNSINISAKDIENIEKLKNQKVVKVGESRELQKIES